MASLRINTNTESILVESDIPGASLPQETPELCNVVQLKWWLSCRGTCTSGKKIELIKRLVEFCNTLLQYLKF